MAPADVTESAASTGSLQEKSCEFSARFENGVVTHFEGKVGRLSVSAASGQAGHVNSDAIAGKTRQGQGRQYDGAVEKGKEGKSHRYEAAPINRNLEPGDVGASIKTQTQPVVARIFQVRGKARLPR